jgi:hypothetical protein
LALTFTDDLRFKLVRVINVLASKNTTEVRGLMKASGLFDLRDGLLLELLNSEAHTTESLQLLQQINLEALAASSKFRESKIIESLVAWLIDTTDKDAPLRQGIVAIFQRQICKSPENAKYISRTVEDGLLVAVLTSKSPSPSMKELEDYLRDKKAEIKKNLDKLLKVANVQQSERIKQQARSAQERSGKRDKLFAALAKDKSAIQAALTDQTVLIM